MRIVAINISLPSSGKMAMFARNATMSTFAQGEQRPSNKGNNFPELHIHIMNIQGWLRGIHHHCSKEHLQGYLDECHYRYNRRNHMETIFDNLITRMVEYEPTIRI